MNKSDKFFFHNFLLIVFILSSIMISSSLEAQGNNGINVKDFSAKGDGRTDDYAAIKKALDYVQSLPNGGRLFFPSGTYMISQPLFLNSIPVLIDGDSYTSSIIKASGSMQSIFYLKMLRKTIGSNSKIFISMVMGLR